jgi:hypothetical protein
MNEYEKFKLYDKALRDAHGEGAWDQEQYDAMLELVNEAKKREKEKLKNNPFLREIPECYIPRSVDCEVEDE